MKNLAKLSFLSVVAALSGCTYSQDSIFPSLYGTDKQEQVLEDRSAAEAGIVLGTTNFEPVNVSSVSNTGTFVGQKVITFSNELNLLQNSIKTNNAELQSIRGSVVDNALQYHKTIGEIEAKLQVGTTPGNPHMFEKLALSQQSIQTMNTNSSKLNQLSAKVAADTANTDYLIDAIRSVYSVSGAVDEDHRQLRILENEAGQTSVLMHSLLNEINGDISRQQQYVDTANNNIAKLSEAIKVGSFGINNPSISRPAAFRGSVNSNKSVAKMGETKPLFVVNFANDNINYKDALKQAVGSAVAQKRDVVFDVVGVNSLQGNNAQKYASKIFQEIIAMGVTADRVNISSKTDAKISNPSVMIFVH